MGRPLTTHDLVHHLNGDTLDNRTENLAVLSRPEHQMLHMQGNHYNAGKRLSQWSRKHTCCRECSTTDISHKGGGLCRGCWDRARRNS
ncbi:hypothetical protein LCGC14_0511260 [marine sediment metagenome]|uniref:HNH nuclease domain-containing protein n=1 Tax=marine sediment metagenome TaxID=412755 RepID=A0A0F9S177_9ZZZZ